MALNDQNEERHRWNGDSWQLEQAPHTAATDAFWLQSHARQPLSKTVLILWL